MVVELVKSVTAMLERATPVLKRLEGVTAPVMVEIGVSGAIMAEHLLRRRADLIYFGVDSWASHEQQPAEYIATGDVHARRTQQQQDELAAFAIDRLRPFGQRAMIYRLDSVAASDLFAEESIDCVFLDGRHDYEGVRRDIEAWYPKIKPARFLCGHDFLNEWNPAYDFTGVARAVREWLATDHRLALELDTGYDWFVRKP